MHLPRMLTRIRQGSLQVPPGCRRYSVELRKPLGMVLEEDRHGSIYVVRWPNCHSTQGSGSVQGACQGCVLRLSRRTYGYV